MQLGEASWDFWESNRKKEVAKLGAWFVGFCDAWQHDSHQTQKELWRKKRDIEERVSVRDLFLPTVASGLIEADASASTFVSSEETRV